MKAVQENLDGLQQWLGSTVGSVLHTALAVEEPSGTSAEWQSILKAFEVPAMPGDERARVRTISPTQRGVPVQEVYDVLVVVVKRAGAALENLRIMMLDMDIDDPESDAQERQFDRLRSLADRLVNDTMNKYKSVVMPKRSMFALAKAAAAKKDAPMGKVQSTAFVLTCRYCGAPRINDKELVCDFCDTKLG
jgi:hypothetical protein